MLKDLTQLARKGNVIELAVAIVLAQFGAGVLSSLVNDILVPPIGLLLGGRSVPSLFFNLTPGKTTTQGGPIDSIEKAHYAGASVIAYGGFLLYLLQFLVVILAAVAVLRWLKRMNAPGDAGAEVWPPPPTVAAVSKAEPPAA